MGGRGEAVAAREQVEQARAERAKVRARPLRVSIGEILAANRRRETPR
jgi:hypothetical protein